MPHPSHTSSPHQPHFYLVAGEASGDNLGGKLLAALKHTGTSALQISGVGGPQMAAQGLASLFDYSELSLMGFSEVLPHIQRLRKRMQQVEADIIAKQPAMVITIDSPGFTFRLVKRLRQHPDCQNIRFVHYVAPTVWAYKAGRAAKTAKLFDKLLTLLPFEPPYFTKHGLATVFTGHPVIEDDYPARGGDAFRERHGILPNTPLILLLPGSRKAEIRRHLQIYQQTMQLLGQRIAGLTEAIVIPEAMRDELEPQLAEWPGRPLIVTNPNEKYDAFSAASVALAKSGTVTLELACAQLPMVVTYRVSAISAWLLRRMIKVPYVTLVNLLLQREAIPEYLQERAKPKALAKALFTLLSEAEAADAQRHAMQLALKQLTPNCQAAPSTLAAQEIWKLLPSNPPQA